MSVSEADTTQRLRIVLSEYGNAVKPEHLNATEGEVTVEKGGVVRLETLKRFGLDVPYLTDTDSEHVETLKNQTGIEIDELANGNLRIRANSHVGHIAFNKFDLVIYPKFECLAKQQEKKFSPLAALIYYAFNLGNLKEVGVLMSPQTFFAEILIKWLLEEAWGIQRRGPFQKYRKEHKDLSIIRGKIDMKTWLRRGGIPSEKMPCEFYRRSFDNVLNQTLCAGLRRSVALARNPELKSKCQFLADTFALSVTEKTLDHRLLADAERGLNRLNAHYEDAIKIIKMLHVGSGGFVFGEQRTEQTRIPGFFFDMNVLFEMVIGKFLADNLPAEYTVKYQSQTQFAYTVFLGKKTDKTQSEKRPPLIKPDIIVTHGENKIVLDTKYKDIGNDKPKSSDLYQLSVYAMTCSHHKKKAGDKKKIVRQARIVYPADSGVQERRIILRRSRFIDEQRKKLCTITLCPVNLVKLAETIAGNGKKTKQDVALEIIGK